MRYLSALTAIAVGCMLLCAGCSDDDSGGSTGVRCGDLQTEDRCEANGCVWNRPSSCPGQENPPAGGFCTSRSTATSALSCADTTGTPDARDAGSDGDARSPESDADAEGGDGRSDTGAGDGSDADGPPDSSNCEEGETFVEEACLSCGPTGCSETEARCVATCSQEEGCTDDPRETASNCVDGVCRVQCL